MASDLNIIHDVIGGAKDLLGDNNEGPDPKAVKAGGSPTPNADPLTTIKPTTPTSISTEGLKEGSNYTYKDGKLTEYTPTATKPTDSYGFDPLSMQLIFQNSVAPYLNQLNSSFNSATKGYDAAANADMKQDAALGIPAGALAMLKTGEAQQNQGALASLYGNEQGAIASAPLDALTTQLGQAADAARLAGYEAEYGQSTNGTSSTASSQSATDIVNAAIAAAQGSSSSGS